MSVGAYAPPRPRCDRRARGGERTRRGLRRDRAVSPGCARGARHPRGPGAGARERWERPTTRGPDGAYAPSRARSDRRRARARNDRRRVVRALELAEAGSSLAPTPTVSGGRNSPADPGRRARRPRRRAGAPDRRAHRRDVRGGRGRRGARRARAGSVAHRGEGARAARDRGLPAPRRASRIVVRTRRYAAYQRKWMRRIPGLVSVDGTWRPTRSPRRFSSSRTATRARQRRPWRLLR